MKKKRKDREEHKTWFQRNQWWVGGLILFVLIAPGAYFIIQIIREDRRLEKTNERFQGSFDDYLTQPKQNTGTNQKARGEVITIDVGERKVDRLYFELPEEFRAKDPDSVATIVWLKWREQEVDKYTDGRSACVEYCDVTVIDRKQRVILGQKQFKGGDPPASLERGSTKGVGPRPYQEIAAYVTSLCSG